MRCSPSGDATSDDSIAVPRGTKGRLPWTSSFDFNVAYAPNWAEGLQFKVDVFNALNHANVDLPNRIFGTPNFGRIFSAKNARELQVGVRLSL